MSLRKIWWLIKSLRFKIFFKEFKFPSYIGSILSINNKGDIIIKKRVRIQPGLRIETITKKSKIIINENTSIGQNFHVTSGDILSIGENVTILGNVFITNIDHDYTEIEKPILEQKLIIKETKIGDNCFIGYGASIQAGTILGKQCIVGTNAVVRGIFPDYCVIVGVPAKIIKKYNFETKKWESVENK